MIPSFQSKTPRFAMSYQASSDLDLAAGRQRVEVSPLQNRVQPPTSNAEIASGKERKCKRILQQSS
jgi:hypothetical protein